MAGVQAHKGLGIARSAQIQWGAEFVAPVPATLCQQGAFSIEAPYGVTAADTEAAIATAERGLAAWRARTAFERADALHAIADEMNISPGNLYYHYRSKDEIVTKIFAQFERELDELFAMGKDRPANVEDTWFWLHLLFEKPVMAFLRAKLAPDAPPQAVAAA